MREAGRDQRVLFVDDDASVGRMFARSARRLGYQVELAKNGAAAVERLSHDPPPVVAVDFRLPDIDGITLAQRLSHSHPDTAFVLVTGDANFADNEGVEGAIASLLLKPWNPLQLENALDQAFELHAQRLRIARDEAAEPLAMLLVEDSPSDALLIRHSLRALPALEVNQVSTLAEATSALHQRRFDIIISDLSLPDGRGLDAVNRLRALAPDTALLVCSGAGDEALLLRVIQLGAQDFVAKQAIDDRALVRAVLLARERCRAERRLAHLAYVDRTTGLANRASFDHGLEIACARARRVNSQLALLLIDLDGFKAINDELGHDAGDAVLREIAERMQDVVRPYDLIARRGGDEFTALLTDFRHETDVEEVTRRLLDAIELPIALQAHEASVTASIGIAFFAGDGESEADLLKRADEAMYAAKRGGKNAYAVAPRAEPSLPAPPGTLRSDSPSIGPSERARTLSRTNEALRQEIASRVEAEAALRVSEEKFRRVTETLPMLVWTCTPDGRCDYLGPQWVAYTGIPAAEQLGYGWVDQLHPDDREQVKAAWNEATSSGCDFDVDFRLRRADGCFHWFRARAVPLRDALGNIVQWFGSNTDIDDLRQADARVHELTRSLERAQPSRPSS